MKFKLFNREHPQGLQIACILFSVQVLRQLLNVIGYTNISFLIPLLGVILPFVAVIGISNDRRWGYYFGLIAAGITTLAIVLQVLIYGYTIIGYELIDALLSVTPFFLLLSSKTRTYVNEYFV